MKTMHIVMPYAADDWGSDDEYEIEENHFGIFHLLNGLLLVLL